MSNATNDTWAKLMESLISGMSHIMKQQQQQMEMAQNTAGALSVARPGTYEGERQAAIIDGWIRSLERYFECNKADDTKKILFASSLLRGPADIWWRCMERLEGENQIFTWDQFKTKLIERFKHKNAHREARTRLATLTQTSTVQTYIDEFHTIQLELPDITEDELLDRFIRGLKPAVQAHVLGQDPFWLSQAEHQALVYENAYGVPLVDAQHQLSSYRGPQPMELDVIRQQRGPLRCYNCGGIGHMQRVCPSDSNQQSRRPSNRSNHHGNHRPSPQGRPKDMPPRD